jgi:hypothetical protein
MFTPHVLGVFTSWIMPMLNNWIIPVIENVFFTFKNIIVSLNINESLLSDVAVFDIGIIALWISVSIDVVARISERYDSDVIANSFENRWENQCLPIVLLVSLLITVILKIFPDCKFEQTKNILYFIDILLFFFSCIVFWKSIKILRKYTSNTENILRELIDNAEKIFK